MTHDERWECHQSYLFQPHAHFTITYPTKGTWVCRIYRADAFLLEAMSDIITIAGV